MKNLLMVIPFFPPMAGGGVYRPLAFVKHLERFGWQPTVIAPRGDAFWIHDNDLLQEIPQACRVMRTPTLSAQGLLSRGGKGNKRQRRSSRGFAMARRIGSALLLPDTYVGWYPFAVKAGRRLLREQKFDAIYSTSPPETSHLIGMKLHAIENLPWVADFRDAWMNLHFLPNPSQWHTRMHRRWEKRVCERACVVVTSSWHERLLRETYPRIRSITRIPNGYDRAEVDSAHTAEYSGERMRIMHAGMLTQTRSALPFLRGLKQFLSARPEARAKVEVTFVGPRESDNERAVGELGLSGVVTFRDSVPHRETLCLEKGAQVLLLIKHTNSAYNGVVPGKLYEYIGLARPILALVPEGEARSRIVELKRGEVADQENVSDVAEKIATMYGHFCSGRLESAYDLSPRPEFERENLTGRLADLLDREVSRHLRGEGLS